MGSQVYNSPMFPTVAKSAVQALITLLAILAMVDASERFIGTLYLWFAGAALAGAYLLCRQVARA